MKFYQRLCAFFVGVTSLTYAVQALGDGLRGQAYIGLHLMLTGLMFWVAWGARAHSKELFRGLLFAGIAARLVLVGVSPFNTHDVQRYLFDGRMVLEGLDPYLNNPDPQKYAALYAEGFDVAPEHRGYRTIYPPLALGVFTLCARAGPVAGFWLWKILITVASILSLLLVAQVLYERRRGQWLVWLSLSPIALLEIGVGAHVDALSMLGVACLVWSLHRGLSFGAAAGLSLAILSKIIPGWLLLGAVFNKSLRRPFLGAVGITLVVYAFMLLIGFSPLGSLLEFARVWRFGSVLASLLAVFDMAQHTLIYAALMFSGWMILTQRLQNKAVEMLLSAIFVWGLATSPVLFPWYALSVLPLLALAPSGILLGWTSALPFTYEVIDAFDLSGVWAPSVWPQILLVLCAGLGMAIDRKMKRQVVLGDRG